MSYRVSRGVLKKRRLKSRNRLQTEVCCRQGGGRWQEKDRAGTRKEAVNFKLFLFFQSTRRGCVLMVFNSM